MTMLGLDTSVLDTPISSWDRRPRWPRPRAPPPASGGGARPKKKKKKKGMTLQEQLASFDRSKLQATVIQKPRPSERDSILDQIRKGLELKDAKKRKLRAKPKEVISERQQAKNDVARKLAERYAVLHGGDDDDSDGSWCSDEEDDW